MPSQETIWEFLKYFEPEDPGRSRFNVTGAKEWPRDILPDPFRGAVADVTERHDALRMVFADTGVNALITFRATVDLPIAWEDLSSLPEEQQFERLRAIAARQHEQTFDLCVGPLWSIQVVRLATDRHLVMVCLFHMIADGWSVQVMLRDLAAAYLARIGSGRAPQAPARRLLDVVGGPVTTPDQRAARAEHWRRRLDPLPDRFAFPPRRPGDGADPAARASVEVIFPRHIGDRLPAFAARHRTTPFIVLLAAYRILLGRWTGWDRVVIGMPLPGRDMRGTQQMVGQFVENVYVATTTTGDATLEDVLSAVHDEVMASIEHMAPFTEIARAVCPDFDRHRPWPFLHLYDAWFQALPPAEGTDDEDEPEDEPDLPGSGAPPEGAGLPSRAAWVDGAPACPAPLLLHAKRGEPGFMLHDVRTGGAVEFNPTFYPEDMVRAVLRAYPPLIEAMLDDPQQRVRDLGGGSGR